MSEENVESSARNRGDEPPRLTAVLVGMDPEPLRAPARGAAGSFVGIDGVGRWFADLAEHFDTWRISRDIRDLGDRVLALRDHSCHRNRKPGRDRVPPRASWRVQGWSPTDFIDYGDKESPRSRRALGVGDVAGER